MDTGWFKSSFSNGGGDNCVEYRSTCEVQVRDSKNPEGPVLHLTPTAWSRFIASV
jgi:hypothetical protein